MDRIKAIIFDLDGTLANTLPLCIRAFRQSVEPLVNRNITDAEIIATFGPSEEGTIMALAPDHYDQGVSDYLQLYAEMHGMCAAPFDGIRALLAFIKSKDIRISMVTGKGWKSTEISLNYFDITSYFEIIETGAPGGPRKAEGIQLILDAQPGISKSETIYIGDTPGDIIACRQVGIPVIAAAWAETAEPEKLIELKPDQLFYSIAEFSEWLNSVI